MSENYNKLLEKLKTLKSGFFAKGLKLELETEIITTTELDIAKQLADDAGLTLTLKTCGCSAVSDIFLAKAMSVTSLLSPMIESSYALDKFYFNIKNIFDEDENLNLEFNLETLTAYKNIDEILSYKNINAFSTVVFGRNDFTASLGKNADYADSDEVLECIKNTLKKLDDTGLDLIAGGNISKDSCEFLNKIDSEKFIGFETRKIVFDKEILKKDYDKALNLALEFELLWLESKSFKNPLDEQRREILSKRFA